MKKRICHATLILSLSSAIVFALLSIYGIFTKCSVAPKLFTTATDVVAFPKMASLWWVFAICAVVLCGTFVVLDFLFVNKGILSKNIFTVVKEKASVINIFLFISCVITLLSLIFVISHKEIIWDYFLPKYGERGYDSFMDFFNHITYVRNPSKVYFTSIHACFPPLSYIYYYFLSLLLPADATVMHKAQETQYSAQLLFIVQFVLSVIAFVSLMKAILKKVKVSEATAIFLLLFSSNVFVFGVLERGNSVFIVTLLLLVAILLRDSDKPYLREIALICIAVAAGFKIYPALFGFIYLKEKRIKEGIRLLIYGVLFFFLPFIFFGGFEGFIQFLKNQTAVQDGDYAFVYNSIKSIVSYILKVITHGKVHLPDTLATFLQISFVAVNFIAFFNKKLSRWESVTLLSSIMVFGPSWSGVYTSIYFVIPLAMFFAENSQPFTSQKINSCDNIYRIIIAVLFGLTFCLNMFVLPNGEPLNNFGAIPLYIINAMIIGKTVYHVIQYLRNKLNGKRMLKS